MACSRPSALHHKSKAPGVKETGASAMVSSLSQFSHFYGTELGKKSKDAGRGVRHLLQPVNQVEDIAENKITPWQVKKESDASES